MPKKGSNSKKPGPVSNVALTPSRAASTAAPQGKLPGKGKLEQQLVCSDDDSQLDSSSIISSASENKSVQDEGAELDEDSQIKVFEDKLKEVIDLTSQKSSHGRTMSYESLCKAFSTKYLPEFVVGRRMTLMDCVERGLKKGKGAEQEAAAKLAVLLCLQLGSVNESEMIYKEYKSTLLTLTSDHSVPLSVRAECSTTIGLCCFLAGSDLLEINEIMLAMESIFSSTGFRSSEGGGVISSELAHLHSAALSSWTLLLTLLSPRQIYDLSQTNVRRLSGLLDSTDVEVRIGAGEAIALIYEGAREFDEDFGFAIETDEESEARQSTATSVDELCQKLRQLATDSHKYRAKKDRKQQRSSFRDILRAIEENEAPDIRVKFGKEILEIDSWARKRQYDTFCQALGSGMNLHLTQNEMLREIFGLGPPLLFDETTNNNKTSKLERHHLNMAAFKARSVARAKNRDKRTAVF